MKENLILVSTPMQRREKLMFNKKKNTVLNNNMQKYIFFQFQNDTSFYN